MAIKVDRPQVSIAVDGVTVYAPDQSGKALLNDVSMELCIGEVVALQGPSGAGKSSLADVLSGLIYADHGEIRLDGTALTHEQILRWRQHVGYVPQSAALLRSTIRENLTWLLPSTPSDAEMDQVLSSTELGLLLESLPLGIETRIDRREGKLSGGERQRIALARELLRRPALLILDEATNALDLSTESKIFSNIRESYPSMSVLVIAHRPESLALADRVLDICDGKMICSDAVKSGGVVAVEIVGPVQGRRHA